MSAQAKRYALLGFGSIGASIAAAWAEAPIAGVELVAACVRPHQAEAARALLPTGAQVVHAVEALLETSCDAVVEAAGQGAVAAHGEAILRAGRELHLMSVGALADTAVAEALTRAAVDTGAGLYLTSGSLAGLDGLRAMRETGLRAVRYVSRKPPHAWVGTAAEAVCDLAALTEPREIFAGTARQAALAYPKNANLAAAVAFAGVGLDATEVRLIADPGVEANTNSIEAEAPFNRLTLEMAGRSFPGNSRSAVLAGMSILAAVRNRSLPLRFG